jgi:hypothetical protein
MFFLCRRVDMEPLNPGTEIIEAAFFARNGLPRLSRGRVIERGTSKLLLYLVRSQEEQRSLTDFKIGPRAIAAVRRLF